MLPEELSANLCSLMPHDDRFTMSMTWEVHPKKLEIIPGSFKYGKGLIRSRAKLAYEDVQVIADFFDGHKRLPNLSEIKTEFHRYDEKVEAHLDNYIKIIDKFPEKFEFPDGDSVRHLERNDIINTVCHDVVFLLKFTRKLENSRNRLVLHSRMSQFVHFSLGDLGGRVGLYKLARAGCAIARP